MIFHADDISLTAQVSEVDHNCPCHSSPPTTERENVGESAPNSKSSSAPLLAKEGADFAAVVGDLDVLDGPAPGEFSQGA